MSDQNKFRDKFKVDECHVKSFGVWEVSLRPEQVTLGSCIISPADDIYTLNGASQKVLLDYSSAIAYCESLLYTKFKCQKINFLTLMMVDKLFHTHVIPRYNNSFYKFDNHWKDPYWPGIHHLDGEGCSNMVFDSILNYIRNEKK